MSQIETSLLVSLWPNTGISLQDFTIVMWAWSDKDKRPWAMYHWPWHRRTCVEGHGWQCWDQSETKRRLCRLQCVCCPLVPLYSSQTLSIPRITNIYCGNYRLTNRLTVKYFQRLNYLMINCKSPIPCERLFSWASHNLNSKHCSLELESDGKTAWNEIMNTFDHYRSKIVIGLFFNFAIKKN